MTDSAAADVPDVETYYDDLAAVYAEIASFPIREHATWPATRRLLGDVDGERVLDAGCGTGEHAADLAADGAHVVAVDASEEMLARARDRHLADGASMDRAGTLAVDRVDLEAGLPQADDGFDAVCCQLVLSHVADPAPLFEEFARVLGPDGKLVLATHHPFHDFRVAEREVYPRVEVGSTMELDPVVESEAPLRYHEQSRYTVQWSEEGLTGQYYRRPLSAVVGAMVAAGFAIDGIEEPVPDDEFRERWPEAYEEFVTRPPEVLCLRGVV